MSSSSANEYLDALLSVIPNHSLPPEIATHAYQKFLDAALRLATGGPARPDDASHLRDAWPEIQPSVQRALHALHSPATSSHLTKRRRSSSPQQPPSSSSPTLHKKPKQDSQKGGGRRDDEDEEDATDLPQLTVYALSATAPVRHKVDITLHTRTLRLAHGGTGAPVARCERAALTRAFILPTRARSSGALQWTLLLLGEDKPPPPAARGARNRQGRSRADAGAGTATVRFELACSVPESGAPPRITAHSSSSSPSSLRPSSTHQALLTLLSATITTPNNNDRPALVLTSVERGTPLAGITAFRGVRETSLWFFDTGVLADARPAEFWALADLAGGEAGVRVRTATGRTCSVVLTRCASVDANSPEQDNGEEEEEGEESEFQMIDGKERERILEWVRSHRDAFGIRDDGAAEARAGAETDAQPVEEVDGGEGNGKVVGDSDSDSDFEASSDTSDGGSPSGTSSSTASGDGGNDSASEADQEDDEDEDEEEEGSRQNVSKRVVKNNVESDEEEEEVVDLDPKHHPLLRAMPNLKMSRAAVDAAVGLVMDDLVGRTSGGPGPPLAAAQDDGEDEEDELEE